MITVEHFRYMDGWHQYPWSDEKEFEEEHVGWHCHVRFTTDDAASEFYNWMQDSMTGVFEAIMRFNGGDPIYTVQIKEEQDAAIFKLKWL